MEKEVRRVGKRYRSQSWCDCGGHVREGVGKSKGGVVGVAGIHVGRHGGLGCGGHGRKGERKTERNRVGKGQAGWQVWPVHM